MVGNIKIFSSKEELAERFCGDFFLLSEKYSFQNKFFNVALSGGRTPAIIFETLANLYKDKINWARVRFFWGDERCVPPDHLESNYGMTKKTLLDKINIPPENVYRIFGENNPVDESARYQKQFLELSGGNFSSAKSDLTMLGLGDDGHTASIFPEDREMFLTEKLFAFAEHPVTKQKRITATGRLINNSQKVAVLVTGNDKAKVLNEILNRQNGYLKYPAAHIKPANGTLEWYIDVKAASLLSKQ